MKPKHPLELLVAESGVYWAFRDSHRLMHQVALMKGARFAERKRCASAVKFEWLGAGRGTHIGSGFQSIRQDYGDEPTQTKKRPA